MGWVVVDGIDGAGKTTICQKISASHSERVRHIPEFSETPIGEIIREVIGRHRYFRLSAPRLAASELLFMLSDSLAKYELVTRSGEKYVVVDRGVFSAIAYQTVRWEEEIGERLDSNEALRLLEVVTRFAPTINLFTHINLFIDIESVNTRVAKRGEKALSPRGLATLQRIQDRMFVLGEHLGCQTICVDDRSIDRLVGEVEIALFE